MAGNSNRNPDLIITHFIIQIHPVSTSELHACLDAVLRLLHKARKGVEKEWNLSRDEKRRKATTRKCTLSKMTGHCFRTTRACLRPHKAPSVAPMQSQLFILSGRSYTQGFGCLERGTKPGGGK